MPTIDFHTYSKETVQNFRPVLAKSIQPEWWKKAKVAEVVNGIINKTIRSCPAMQDWLSSGYLIVANRDLYVRNGVTEEDDNSRYYHTEDTVQTEHSPYASQTHPTVQMHDAFNYMSKSDSPMKDAFKMSNPWCITTPPGYSCFYLDPFLFQNDYFATFQGIIDTDKFNVNKDNSQIILYPKVDHSFVITKGTPICQLIPYKREEWVATYTVKEHKDYVENLSKYTSESENKTMDELSRTGLADALQKAGPYKRGKIWTPKHKDFKEDMEGCPFDPTTGKMKPEFEHLNTSNTSEVQIEMDFKDKQRSMTDLNWDGHDGS
jgi:hypothetical protein